MTLWGECERNHRCTDHGAVAGTWLSQNVTEPLGHRILQWIAAHCQHIKCSAFLLYSSHYCCSHWISRSMNVFGLCCHHRGGRLFMHGLSLQLVCVFMAQCTTHTHIYNIYIYIQQTHLCGACSHSPQQAITWHIHTVVYMVCYLPLSPWWRRDQNGWCIAQYIPLEIWYRNRPCLPLLLQPQLEWN